MASMQMPRSGMLRFSGMRVCGALALGALAEALLYGGPVGWLYAVFAAALVVMIAVKAVCEGQFARLGPPLILAVGGIAALAVEPTWAAFLLAFLGAASVALAAETDLLRRGLYWLWRLAVFTLSAPGAVFADMRGGVRHVPAGQVLASGRQAAVGWGVPVLLALVFVGLFALGNPVIAEWLRWLVQTDLGGFPVHLADALASAVRAVIVALLCWPFLRSPVRIDAAPKQARMPAATLSEKRFDLGMVIRSLVLFNLVFGAQNALDLLYLWGEGTLPAHLTYAEYAHRGTYPLALAAVLVGAFVVFAMPPGSQAERNAMSRWLVFVWLAQTALLTLSCLKRLDLYVSVYSLTYLRVTAFVATAAIAVGLGWISARLALKKSNRWLINACIVTWLFGLLAGSIVDVGARIAWFNVTNSRDVGGDGVPLDFRYLERAVGASAIPALAWYEEQTDGNVGWSQRRKTVRRIRLALTQDFEAELSDWRAWTLRRWLLAKRIE